MAYENQVQSITLVAAADLSAKQYRVVKIDSNGKAAMSDADDLGIGILQNNPGSGQPATVGYSGVSKALAGGTIAAGARVTSDANGALIAASSAGDAVVGVAVTGAASGDLFPVLINPFPFVALA
jgi:hypothetical protein